MRRAARPGGHSGSSVGGEIDPEEESRTIDPVVEPSNQACAAASEDLAPNNHPRMPHHRNFQQRPVNNIGTQQNHFFGCSVSVGHFKESDR